MKEFSYPTLEPYNFGGLEKQDYQSSKVVIFPVPYESTTYYKSGTKEGPQAIIDASRHMELYDAELEKDISQVGIFTLPELEPSKDSPKETLLRVERVITKILSDKKFPLMLGGEHSITLGAVSAFKKKYPRNLSVLQLDAHTDLREKFEGTKYHQGSIMRRVRELNISVTQVGIRSMSEEEAEYIKKEKIKNIFYAPKIPIERIIATLKKNVYLTFDLDALDPSIMPSVGTPEPGGLGWYETLQIIKKVAEKRRIVGADVVELCPIPGLIAPDFLAAKLVYKIIGYAVK